MFKKIVLSLLLLSLGLFLVHGRLIGYAFEEKLERLLSEIFGMPVAIQRLEVEPLLGLVKARRITFQNQSEFAPGPHLDARDLRFDIDFLAIRAKRVAIGTIFLDRPFYFIDRIPTPEGPRNNVITWYRHIKDWNARRPKDEDPTDTRKWEVTIERIVLHRGTFVFHDRSGEERDKKLVFHNLEAHLNGFKRPVPVSVLGQSVKVEGLFGEEKPAPVRIHGIANFTTSKVSFNLEGRVRGGSVSEYQFFWRGLPLRVIGGTYDLDIQAVCDQKQLRADNDLTLYSLETILGPKATHKFWGLPMQATAAFLQDQEVIELEVPVHGDLADPKFEALLAFRRAFQDVFVKRIRDGVGSFMKGTSKLAFGTREVLFDTPVKAVGAGIGKLTQTITGNGEAGAGA